MQVLTTVLGARSEASGRVRKDVGPLALLVPEVPSSGGYMSVVDDDEGVQYILQSGRRPLASIDNSTTSHGLEVTVTPALA